MSATTDPAVFDDPWLTDPSSSTIKPAAPPGLPPAPTMPETPAPLESAADLPPFPVDALPGWVAEMVAALSDELQVPVELPAMVALGVAAVGSAGRALTVVPQTNWREWAQLYTVVALPPGCGKSPVFSALTKPLQRVERELQDTAKPQLAKLRTERSVLEKRIARHRDAASRTEDDKERTKHIQNAADDAKALESLGSAVEPRLTTSDVTPEEIVRLLSVHNSRFAVVSDEGGLFDIMAGRYGQQTSLDPFLKAHTGGRVVSDRVGKKGEGTALIVDEAHLTMCFTVQPQVLEELGRDKRLGGRGITARFLFAVPTVRLGYRDVLGAKPVPESIRLLYEQHMAELLRTLIDRSNDGMSAPLELILSSEAVSEFDQFRQRCERSLRPGGALHALQEWGAKLPGQTLRIAANLHLMQTLGKPSQRIISAETMRNAIDIAACLVHHARAANDLLGVSDAISNARLILDWLRRDRVKRFTKRELSRKFRKFDAATREPALRHLQDTAWIADEPQEGREGRPSEVFVVHPMAWRDAPDDEFDFGRTEVA